MSPERFARAAGTLALLILLAAPARAENAITLEVLQANGLGDADDVDVTGTPDLRIGKGHRLNIRVSRDSGNWSNTFVVLEADFAEVKERSSSGLPHVIVVKGAAPTGAQYSPEPTGSSSPGGQRWQPKWLFSDASTGSGAFSVLSFDFALDSWSSRDGTPISITARLQGTHDGASVSVTSTLPTQHFAVAPLLATVTPTTALQWSNFEHPDGRPGMRIRYNIQVRNLGGATFRSANPSTPSFELAIDTPDYLETFRIFSHDLYTPSIGNLGVPAFANGAPVFPGPDLVKLTSSSSFANPSEEDFSADPPTSWAQSFSEVYQSMIYSDAVEWVAPNGYFGYSHFILVDTFVSCADLELVNGRTGPDWDVRVRATVRDVTHSGVVRELQVGTDASPILVSLPAVLTQFQESCSVRARTHVEKWPNWDDPGASWANGKLLGVGSEALFKVSIESPMGAATVSDAVIVDRLPIGANYRARVPDRAGALYGTRTMCSTSPDCGGFGDCVDGQCEGIYGTRVYYCDGVSQDFGSAGFASLRASNQCRPAVLSGPTQWVPPGGMPMPSYLVLHAPSMQARAWNDDGMALKTFEVTLDTTAASPALLENTAWFAGTYNLGATPADAEEITTQYGIEPEAPDTTFRWRDAEAAGSDVNFFEDDAYYRVIDYQCVRLIAHTSGPSVLDPGQCSLVVFRAYTRDSLPLAQNAVLRWDLPPGILTTGVAYNDFASPGPTYPTTLANNGIAISHNAVCPDVGGTVSEPVAGDDPFEWRYAGGCALNPTTAASNIGTLISVGFCTDPTYLFVDDQVLTFRARFVSMDNGPDAEGELCQYGTGGADDGDEVLEANESGYPQISFRMRVLGEQDAPVVPVCTENGAAFSVSAVNPAGRRLLDVGLQFDLPADATFAAVSEQSPATGTVIEVSTSATGPWLAVGAMPSGDVRHVRLRGNPATLELEPFVGRAGFVVHLTTGATSGTSLVGTATMTSDIGTKVQTGSFVVGSCQRLTVHKYFDGDADQAQDPLEPALSDWSFTVSDSSGTEVGHGITGADGTFELLLPAGTYTVHEDAATASPDYSWALTTPQDVQVTFAVGGLGATVAFGNRCQCGTDVCMPLACTPLGGQAASCGAPVALDCDDSDMCTTDSCDPADLDGDACVHEPVACDDDSGLFSPVTDATGAVVGAIRCALVAGAIACDVGADTDGDGRPNLVIYPDYGGACE